MTKPLLQEGLFGERPILIQFAGTAFLFMLIAEFDSVFIDAVFLSRN